MYILQIVPNHISVLRNIHQAVLSMFSLTGPAAFVNVAALAGDFDATRPV